VVVGSKAEQQKQARFRFLIEFFPVSVYITPKAVDTHQPCPTVLPTTTEYKMPNFGVRIQADVS